MKEIEKLIIPERNETISVQTYLLRELIPKIQEIIEELNTLIKSATTANHFNDFKEW